VVQSELLQQGSKAARRVGRRNRQPILPQGPIGDAIRARAVARVQAILDQRKAELNGAIQSEFARGSIRRKTS